MKQPATYIMANRRRGTIYIGVTSDWLARAYQHREELVSAFATCYHCKLLVWYELPATMIEAIHREKQIKAGSRNNKFPLVESANPHWADLYDALTCNVIARPA